MTALLGFTEEVCVEPVAGSPADVGKNIAICICGCPNGLAESTVSSEKAAAAVVFP